MPLPATPGEVQPAQPQRVGVGFGHQHQVALGDPAAQVDRVDRGQTHAAVGDRPAQLVRVVGAVQVDGALPGCRTRAPG